MRTLALGLFAGVLLGMLSTGCTEETAGCTRSGDCPDGNYCAANAECVTQNCVPGETRCSGSFVLKCAEDGSGFVLNDECASALACQGGTCIDLGAGCTDDAECGDGQHCAGEAGCQENVCEPSSVWCAENVLHQCSSSGDVDIVVEACDGACNNGECVAKEDVWEVSKVNVYFVAVLIIVLLLVTYIPALPMAPVEFVFR